MDYIAVFNIHGGSCPNPRHSRIKIPYKETITSQIIADNPDSAYKEAVEIAQDMVKLRHTDPSTGKLRVELISLSHPNGDVPIKDSRIFSKRDLVETIRAIIDKFP